LHSNRRAHPSTLELPSRAPRRWRRLAVAGAAVLTCGAFTAGPALANSSGESGSPVGVEWSNHQRRHAGGTIAAVNGTNLVVTQRDGSPLTVTTSGTTTVSTTTAATLADVTPGSFVSIRVRAAEDGTLTAKRIAIKPASADASAGDRGVWDGWKSWRRGLSGVVESYDVATGVITITTDEGLRSVFATETTTVTKTVALNLTDLTVGTTVKLKGSFADDGTFAATHVQVLASTAEAPPSAVEPPATTAPTMAAATEDEDVDDGASPSNSRYHGTVQSVDGATFALSLRDGSVVTVITSDTTEFRNKLWQQGDDGAPASLADVTAGAWVKVKGTLDGTTLFAEKVTVGPHSGEHDGHRRGDDDNGGWGQRQDGDSREEQRGQDGEWSKDDGSGDARSSRDGGDDRESGRGAGSSASDGGSGRR
jgi:hypothetical protein